MTIRGGCRRPSTGALERMAGRPQTQEQFEESARNACPNATGAEISALRGVFRLRGEPRCIHVAREDEHGDRRAPCASRDSRAGVLAARRRGSVGEREQGRFMAQEIPGASYVELPGTDPHPGSGGGRAVSRPPPAILRAAAWTAGAHEETEPDTVLATVLFTDIVGSSERLATLGDRGWREVLHRHHEIVRRNLLRHRGVEVDTAGDGFFASFDGPARAIRCACAITESVRELGIDVRAGLHTGECELVDGKIAGIAVHTGARIASQAQPAEVLVSSTVKDLVAGSGIVFNDRGQRRAQGHTRALAAVRSRRASLRLRVRRAAGLDQSSRRPATRIARQWLGLRRRCSWSVLLTATTAAFALTEGLKLQKSPIFRTKVDEIFSPVCDCEKDAALIRSACASATGSTSRSSTESTSCGRSCVTGRGGGPCRDRLGRQGRCRRGAPRGRVPAWHPPAP